MNTTLTSSAARAGGKIVLIAASLVTLSLSAAVRPSAALSLDNVFGDHMVLQRDRPIRFSGCGQYGMTIRLEFADEQVETAPDRDGRWTAEFPARAAGGPYTLKVSRPGTPFADAIVLADLLVGDVWYCSGQSNMEMPMWGDGEFYRFPKGDEIARTFKDDGLRLLRVPRTVAVDGPQTDIMGRPQWGSATSAAAIEPTSACGFWFGARLREALGKKVPVGIITCAWGGSRIEPWIPRFAWERALETSVLADLDAITLPKVNLDVAALQAAEAETKKRIAANLDAWVAKFEATSPAKTAEAKATWGARTVDESKWRRTTKSVLLDEPGVVWYRYEVEIPKASEGHAATCHLGFVNDCDETWFDGEKIGETDVHVPDYWNATREYPIRALKAGKTVVAIRAKSHYLAGGVSKDLAIVDAVSGERIAFGGGEFLERLEFRPDLTTHGQRPAVPWGYTADDRRTNFSTPTTLYNGMTAPLTAMNIRGVLWYQGCSNADEALAYDKYQKLLIAALRTAWRDEQLPFILTQLSAYQEYRPKDRLPDDFWKKFAKPSEAAMWKDFRLMQERAYSVPGVGVACTVDVGDHSDIHPTNKIAVAERLLSEALRISYGDKSKVRGPHATAARRDGAAVIVSFGDVGKGLVLDGGASKFHTHLFALAEKDAEAVWADGELLADGTVRVTAKGVANPTRVEYACSGYPPGVAFRRADDGFPVFPFAISVD